MNGHPDYNNSTRDTLAPLLSQAQGWLDKAVALLNDDPPKPSQSEMAFKMALKKEREFHGG